MQNFFLILLLGVFVGWLASRIGQPAAVAQVLLGLIIGPPLLGWVNSNEFLETIGQLGIVLLLGMAGLRISDCDLGLNHRRAGLFHGCCRIFCRLGFR